MTNQILLEIDAQQIATLTLNRPQQRNAFDEDMIAQMQQALDYVAANDHLRVLVLRAEGEHFCAGADIDWMRRSGSFSRAQNEQDARALAHLLQTLDRLNKPTIAVVQGAVYGGGVGLVACCDLAVGYATARFCLSEVRLGLIPAVISPYVIAAIGARQARRYFQTAEVFDTRQARQIGLLHEVMSANNLPDQLASWIDHLLKAAPQALTQSKQLIRAVLDAHNEDDLIEQTVQCIASRRSSDEAREGLDAFLQKRKPGWRQENE